jgi:hypothetical protein
MRSALALLLMLLVLGPAVALAHRGWSGYDSSKVLTLTGTIRAAGYEHSHGFVKLETPGKMWRVVVLAPFSRRRTAACLPRTASVGCGAHWFSRASATCLSRPLKVLTSSGRTQHPDLA